MQTEIISTRKCKILADNCVPSDLLVQDHCRNYFKFETEMLKGQSSVWAVKKQIADDNR